MGELPDIAISNANVIKALKNLCQRDDQSAQIVLRLLATSLANNATDSQIQDLNDALAEAVTEVAMAARVNMDVVMKDPSFQREAAGMFVKFANSLIVDGVYAVYFSRLVGMGAGALSKKLVGGTIKQFVVRKGMEAVAGKAIKGAIKAAQGVLHVEEF